VREVEVVQWYEAVGTIRPFIEISVEAQVTARVREVLVRPGERVERGQRLVRLEADQSQSQRQQAARAVSAAQAEYDRTRSQVERMRQLYQEQVISKEEIEATEAAYLQAEANLGANREALREAGIGVGFTEIVAQEDGEVAKRFVEPGDLAYPGKSLLTLQTGGALRLEAPVREGLIALTPIGATLPVVIDSLGLKLEARVAEVEPMADPSTRSFLVKANLPDQVGLYPGMYAKLLVPASRRTALVVPPEAVVRVGQLETVRVRGESGVRTVFVRTGRTFDEGLEVLSGLAQGEGVLLEAAPEAAPEAEAGGAQ
jgi:RND family efflux transporter MFP subunit